MKTRESVPTHIGIEAIGFTGPIYLDDVEAWTDRSRAAPTPQQQGANNPPAEQTPEDWLASQPWLKKVGDSMPPGVSLLIMRGDPEESGWDTVEVRTSHTPESGFDPNVSPMLGMFAVSKDRSTVKYFQPGFG